MTGPTSFGPGGTSFATSSTGNVFGIDRSSGYLFIQQGYISQAAINSAATYNNSSFASLGLTQGAYSYQVGTNAITLQVGDPVPEPATWAMMIGGFGVVGGAMRRRRKIAALA